MRQLRSTQFADFLSAASVAAAEAGEADPAIAVINRQRALDRLREAAAATEICVVCGDDTGISIATPVEKRAHYVEGAGQCCPACV